MTDFKVGDTVRLTGPGWTASYVDLLTMPGIGAEVTLTDIDEDGNGCFEWQGRELYIGGAHYAAELVEAANVAPSATSEESDYVDTDEFLDTTAADRFAYEVRTILNDIGDTIIAKNEQYGNSALEPVRIFSKASVTEQIKVRMDDKISRLVRGNGEGDEDALTDLLGYIVLLKIAESEDD